MRIQNIRFLFFSLLLASSFDSRALNEEWNAKLKNVYASEASFIKTILDNNGYWHLKYNVVSNILNPVTNKYEEHIGSYEMIAGNDIRYTNSSSIEVFMDKHDVFTISKNSKSVMRTPTYSHAMDRSNIYPQVIGEDLLKANKIIGQATVNESGIVLQRYDLVPYDSKSSPHSHFSVYVDETSNTFKKVFVKLNPATSKEIRDYTFIVNEKKEVKLPPGWLPVKDRILTESNKLKQPYSNYTYRHIK